jgi:hypothetical protein
MKRLLVVLSAAALFVGAAIYRHGDSAHAMGMISLDGGRAHHPVHLPSGEDRYTLVVTGTVLPPFSGDARVIMEGKTSLPHDVYGSDPIIDLGLRRRPYFSNRTLTGLQPRDRFTIWVVLRPPEAQPAGAFNLSFYDTATDHRVLQIPVIFGGGGGHHHEG